MYILAQTNVEALLIRIGFWGFLIIILVETPPPPNPVLIIKAPTVFDPLYIRRTSVARLPIHLAKTLPLKRYGDKEGTL